LARKTPLNLVVRVSLSFYLLSFLTLVVYAFVTSTTQQRVIAAFQISYGFLKGLELFFEYLIPIQVTALIIAFSLFLRMSSSSVSNRRRPFHGIVSSTIVLTLVVTALYTFFYLTSLPPLVRGIDQREFYSRSARDFRQRADDSFEKARELEKALEETKDDASSTDDLYAHYEQALKYYSLYLSVDEKNETVQRLRSFIEEKLAVRKPAAEEEDGAAAVGEEGPGNRIEEYLKKAGDYLAADDYFSAYYYANLVLQMDEKQKYGSAKIIRDEAWSKITGYRPTKADEEAKRLFERKLAGFEAFDKEKYIEAYYIFRQLNEEYPRDREIADFLQASLEKAQTMSFFADEAENTLALPGVMNVTFLNQREVTLNGRQRGLEELLYIHRIVNTPSGLYFHGIEVIGWDASGRIYHQFRAPYGKLLDDRINMRCLRRTDAEKPIEPVFEIGNPGELSFILPLSQSIQYLSYYRPHENNTRLMSLGELWSIGEPLEKNASPIERAGYHAEEVEMELLMRLVHPFLFLVMSLLAVSFGWTYRARYLGRPPLLTYILIPLLPFLAAQVTTLFVHAHRILLGFFLISMDFTAALVLLVVMEGIFLTLSLALMAGQVTD
jgi:hypothetical protein